MMALSELLHKYDLDILGAIPYDPELEKNPIQRESQIVQNSVRAFYSRLNLPQ